MRRAIVHIGMPRTGSTSFQEVLARLRPRLAQVGLCYPELAPPGSSNDANINHYQLGQALDHRRPACERRAALERLQNVLAATEADTVILSYEDFAVQRPSFRVPETLAALFARHDFAMNVAVVVKPQVEQLASAYALRAQLVAETRTFRTFVRQEGRSGRYDYDARLEPWRKAAAGRVTAVPLRDRRSDAPLLARIVGALGLEDRLGLLLEESDLAYVSNRSSGPVAVEAARRLRLLRAHRQVEGHPRLVGHYLDNRAWSRGLDAERFCGDAPDGLRRVAAHYASSNERFAAAYWRQPWDAVVAPAPDQPENELASRATPEAEAQVALLVSEAVAHFGFRARPAWQRGLANLLEGGIDRLGMLFGYPFWRVR